MKGALVSCFCLCGSLALGQPAATLGGHLGSDWGGSLDAELKPPANSHVSKLSPVCGPANILPPTSWETQPEPTSQVTPEFRTLRN